ncbi:DNA-binding protein [Micromonospora fulviviridis]|uniref:ComEA family DNA-binding protein n=1 Tax=Micromonospora fulviviridis TaxID=47860 RepID=UPI00199B2DBD|nr:ComEA family DNA-binding protein [Micromonospora fulviviridis]GGS06714.1 DNA-binding protein [Micromonospora fulviviridis]
MSDDEETTVRRRLARLFEPVDVLAPPERAAMPPVIRPGPGLDPDLPPRSRAVSAPDSPPVGSFPGPIPERASGSAAESDRVDPEAGERWPAASRVDEAPPAAPDNAADPRPSLASRLPGPGAFDPGRRGVRALAVVAAVVVLVAGVWAWRSRPHAEPVRPVAAVSAPESSAPAPTGSTGQVVVALAGKVRRPGLVRLPAGARVADAIEAAGGALPGVDVALLNPARKVTDGELILVGVTAPPGQGAPAAGGGGPAAGGAAPGSGPVNLNTATLAQLDALPGVGPVLAQRILDHRDQHGGFRSVSDLRQVDGIGDARYEQLKDLVTV